MEAVTKSLILSLMMAVSCRAFFDTLLPRRHFHHSRISRTAIPAFFAGFLVIAFTPIPPYLFQPVRVVVILFVIVTIYYKAGIGKGFLASVLFCTIYWVVSLSTISLFPLFPSSWSGELLHDTEAIIQCIHLGLMLLLHFKCKNRFLTLTEDNWIRFSLFPMLGLIFIVSLAMTSWDGSPSDSRAKLTAIVSFIVINGSIFYFILDLLNKEKEMHQLRLIHERTLSQMNQYHNNQKTYEQQRKYLHDYKNQLDCIQGMVKAGKNEEALAYISRLTGNIRKNTEYINTNHTVINVILNQKYQKACEQGITMSITVNDLSPLSMKEEQLVSLLGNLLDNAIEACLRLNPDLARIIYFKMIIEEGQLILSTRNPVSSPLIIQNNRIQTQKSDPSRHGIGLLNIDSIIRENAGTSVLECEDGWFHFSAVIPLTPEA